MNNLGWFETQLTNGRNGVVKAVLKNWIFLNTPGGRPNSPNGKVQLTTTGSVGGNAGGSLNTKDQFPGRTDKDLKAHFYFQGIAA